MDRIPDLSPLAERLASMDLAHEMARQAVERDKANRSRKSIGAMLMDLLAVTPAEETLCSCVEQLEITEKIAAADVPAWVRQRMDTLIDADEEARPQRDHERARLCSLGLRLKRVEKWVGLAAKADDSLIYAAKCCASASSTEFLDFLTKSPAISFLSSIDTSGASSALKSAKEALGLLRKTFPKRREKVEPGQVDDFPDLILDILLDPAVDILSLMNISSLDAAKTKCDVARESTAALLRKLRLAESSIKRDMKRVESAIAAIEAPFKAKALNDVPNILRKFC